MTERLRPHALRMSLYEPYQSDCILYLKDMSKWIIALNSFSLHGVISQGKDRNFRLEILLLKTSVNISNVHIMSLATPFLYQRSLPRNSSNAMKNIFNPVVQSSLRHQGKIVRLGSFIPNVCQQQS
uniref:Uncharacterized protein n=1 Tax=Megaselia scalaris TaxID=36166 RepID=T1GDT6_MEGSC